MFYSNFFIERMFGYLLESPRGGDSNKYPNNVA